MMRLLRIDRKIKNRYLKGSISMKNVEFYAKELADLVVRRQQVAVRKSDGIPCECANLKCCDCLFQPDNMRFRCNDKCVKEWAESEHVEYEVDWSKVPVDTSVYCQANLYQNACRAHFAKFKNGIVYVWKNGKTSFTSHDDDMYSCECARLVKSYLEWMKRKEK